MKETISNEEEIGFLFNVDILIKSRSNALALQSLLEFINKEEQIADFRIQSGIELGKIIEVTLQSKKDSFAFLHKERKKHNLMQDKKAHHQIKRRLQPFLVNQKMKPKHLLPRTLLQPKHPTLPTEIHSTYGLIPLSKKTVLLGSL